MTEETPKSTANPLRRWAMRVLVAIVAMFVGVELVARISFGLGDPPITVADSEVEYLPQPNQSVRWLHSRFGYNSYSQRSDNFSRTKTDRAEFRVLVIGDSIVNGWPTTDQSKLATTILQRDLAAKLGRKVIVANAACASWGPPNQLAYLKRFGFFDANVVIVVLSSHDYADVSTFAPDAIKLAGLNSRKPLCATDELLRAYVVPWLSRRFQSPDPVQPPTTAPVNHRDIATCMAALREMIAMGRSSDARVIVAQYLNRDEIETGRLMPGHAIIRDEAIRAGAEVQQLGPAFVAAHRAGKSVFSDDIHPTELGQRILAGELERAVGNVENAASLR